MREAVIVTARTGLTKAWSGGLNRTHGATMAGHVIGESIKRAGIEASEVEDVMLGCSLPEGATGRNIARASAIAAGCPVSTAGMTVSRQCSSGLQAIAIAAQRIVYGEGDIYVAGGVESVSCVQNQINTHRRFEPTLLKFRPDVYMPMVDTAEVVANRYGISREQQDAYGLRSQLRAAEAQRLNRFQAEIAPMNTTMSRMDKQTGGVFSQEITVSADEGILPNTTLEALRGIRTVVDGGSVHAGNASQLSDGASAAVVMERAVAERKGLSPLGVFRGFAVTGCEPNEMGIGPVFAIPRLLARTGVSAAEVGLWEINEAFAVQVIYCRDRLNIPDEILKATLNKPRQRAHAGQ